MDVKFKTGNIASLPNTSTEDAGTLLFAQENKEDTSSVYLVDLAGEKMPIIDAEMHNIVKGDLIQNTDELINVAPLMEYKVIHPLNPHGFIGANRNSANGLTYSVYNARLNDTKKSNTLSYDNNWFAFCGEIIEGDSETIKEHRRTYNTNLANYSVNDIAYYRGELQFTSQEEYYVQKIKIHYNVGAGGDGIRPPKGIDVFFNEVFVTRYEPPKDLKYEPRESLECEIDCSTHGSVPTNKIDLHFYLNDEFIFLDEIEIFVKMSSSNNITRVPNGMITQIEKVYDTINDTNNILAKLGADSIYTTILFQPATGWDFDRGLFYTEPLNIKTVSEYGYLLVETVNLNNYQVAADIIPSFLINDEFGYDVSIQNRQAGIARTLDGYRFQWHEAPVEKPI